MKIPSVNKIFDEMVNTIKRFPFPVLNAVAASLLLMYLVGKESGEDYVIFNFVQTFVLGIGLYTAIAIIDERKLFSNTTNIILHIAAGVFQILFFLMLPSIEPPNEVIYRFVVIGAAIHLFVAFAPYIKSKNQLGFWNYNKTLFLQFLLSAFYSMVIYGGIAIALGAITILFDADIHSETFGQIFIFVAGIFNTIHFLAGLPNNWDETDKDTDYPVGLKIFTQYVLLPLVTIYLAILYGYMIKIIIEWELPQGILPYLVLVFSGLGIFSLLLIYPLSHNEKYSWIKKYSYLFYFSLFPLLALIYIAIFIRIGDYGFTENRYFVLILAIWLTGMAIYLIVNRLRNIKAIPISLCIIAIVSAYGPLSAFNVSERNQFQRLKEILAEIDILENGKVKQGNTYIAHNKNKDISDIVSYLVENHGYKSLQPIFEVNLDSLLSETSRYSKPHEIVDLMGVEFTYADLAPELKQSFYFSSQSDYNQVIDVKNYDIVFDMNVYMSDNEYKNFKFYNDDTLHFYSKPDGNKFELQWNERQIRVDVDSLLLSLIEKGYGPTEYSVYQPDMIYTAENNTLQFKLIFNTINAFRKKNDSLIIRDFSYKGLIKDKTTKQNIDKK